MKNIINLIKTNAGNTFTVIARGTKTVVHLNKNLEWAFKNKSY